MTYRPLLVAPLLLLGTSGGCLGPNPLLDAGDEIDGESESGESDTDEASTTQESETADTSETDTGPATCTDTELNGNETAIDCGGDCPPCDDGKTCELGSDCVSGVCDAVCQAPACDDAVLNGDELEIDCGGACTFCELSTFIAQWDDIDGQDAQQPRALMFEDGELAISFHTATEARLRWFQELGAPLTPSETIGEGLTFAGYVPIPLAAREDLDEPSLLALISGEDPMSTSNDLFLVERDMEMEGDIRIVFQGPAEVLYGEVATASTRAIMAWQQDKQVYLRRRDFSIGNGEWIDVQPHAAETSPAMYDGSFPDLAVAPDGTIVVVWSRCAKEGTPCSIALRRFDGEWIDEAPFVVTAPGPQYFTNPQISVGADGRIGLVWTLLDLGDSSAIGQILEPDLSSVGEAWVLQENFPSEVGTDIVALADGSFAYAWADQPAQRVHLRRYVGNDEAKLPEIGDEAPWPQTPAPMAPSLASAGNRLLVVWETDTGTFTQIAGQVLAF